MGEDTRLLFFYYTVWMLTFNVRHTFGLSICWTMVGIREGIQAKGKGVERRHTEHH